MCSLEHNEEGIFSQNMIAKFGVQVLYVFKYKYKYYINCSWNEECTLKNGLIDSNDPLFKKHNSLLTIVGYRLLWLGLSKADIKQS